jgi:hypothetical protein
VTTTLERLRTALAGLNLTAIDARLETLLESASKKDPSYGEQLCTPLRCSTKRNSMGMFDGTSLRRYGFAPPKDAAHPALTGLFCIRRVQLREE